jgi:hypothetical protein
MPLKFLLDFRFLFGYIDFMIQKLDAPISVVLVYNHHARRVEVAKILWEGREYKVNKLGLHHVFRKGETLFHVFSVEAQTLFFRIILDTNTLSWRVAEIADGEPN